MSAKFVQTIQRVDWAEMEYSLTRIKKMMANIKEILKKYNQIKM